NMKDITSTIATLYGGNSGNQHFEYDGQQYDVMVQLADKDMRELSQINKIYVRSQTGQQIPLSSLVTVTAETGADDFPHYNRLRSASVSAELAPGYSMGQVVNYLQYAGPHFLPGDTQYTFGGTLKQFLRNQGSIAGIFIMALIFIYLVLAAQFESFIDPLVVLFSVPLSMLGGLILLKIAGGTLNIFSEIGMVTLIGLVSKHGILITEFINRQRANGMALHDAIVTAAGMRLRPILMTTGAMVLGAVPLALASGAGSADRHQIGWVIVGGMLFGTFFSLFVVPVAYSFLSYFKRDRIDS
ncbi:MAG: efflux RND transporter permease subunit, partial [Gammaproteobacteria bacterium]|nr:efflux RND transporter permease subunit [Gammaproteobacteria bacterium]